MRQMVQADRTPLHLAALQGHSTLASLLIGRGASVDAKDENDMTPLHKAATKVTFLCNVLYSMYIDIIYLWRTRMGRVLEEPYLRYGSASGSDGSWRAAAEVGSRCKWRSEGGFSPEILE